MKLSYLLPLSLCGLAFAAQATETPEMESYRYGMNLDIAKVIAIDDPQDPFVCEVITAKMVYLNSAGETKTVAYRKLSRACSQQS